MVTDPSQGRNGFGRLSTEVLRKLSSEVEANAALKILLGSWPNANPHDPEIYRQGLIALFQRYPPAAVARVCDPVIGIPSKYSFLPSIAEVTEALEEQMRPIRDAQRDRKTAQLLQQHRDYPITKEEKERVKAVSEKAMLALGQQFSDDQSADINDHIARDGTMSFASATKFRLKQAGYQRRPSRG